MLVTRGFITNCAPTKTSLAAWLSAYHAADEDNPREISTSNQGGALLDRRYACCELRGSSSSGINKCRDEAVAVVLCDCPWCYKG